MDKVFLTKETKGKFDFAHAAAHDKERLEKAGFTAFDELSADKKEKVCKFLGASGGSSASALAALNAKRVR